MRPTIQSVSTGSASSGGQASKRSNSASASVATPSVPLALRVHSRSSMRKCIANWRRPSASAASTSSCSSTTSSGRGEHRRLERQLLDHVAADVAAGAQEQVDQRRARHDDGVVGEMVGDPRVRLEREAAREQPLVLADQRHGGGQDRVAGRRAGHCAAGPASSCGAGRRRSGAGAAGSRGERPVDGDARDVGGREQAREGLGLRAVGAQRRHEHGVLAHAPARHPAQHAVRAELDPARDARGLGRRDAVGEADRLAHVLHPVLGVRDLGAGGDRDRRRAVRELLGDRCGSRRASGPSAASGRRG